MKKRFTEEQIVRILKGAEMIGNAAEVCRREITPRKPSTTGSASMAVWKYLMWLG